MPRSIVERDRRDSLSLSWRPSSESGLMRSTCFWSMVDLRALVLRSSWANMRREKSPKRNDFSRDQRRKRAEIVCDVFEDVEFGIFEESVAYRKREDRCSPPVPSVCEEPKRGTELL